MLWRDEIDPPGDCFVHNKQGNQGGKDHENESDQNLLGGSRKHAVHEVSAARDECQSKKDAQNHDPGL